MKRTILLRYFLLLLLSASLACNGQEKKEQFVRRPVVAGSFYPADAGQLRTQLNHFFQAAGTNETHNNIAAVIVPHAGYLFSGEVAAAAYARLDPNHAYSRIFIIGTCHHQLLNGASVYNRGDYQTPLGIVRVDTELANRLIHKSGLFSFSPGAHSREHSVEVQLPFLQFRLKQPFKIVSIVVGEQSEANCKKMAAVLKPYFNSDNLFVISSDFSHYPTYSGAVEADKRTGDAISKNSPELFVKALQKNVSKNIEGLVTSCCGRSSVLTLLYLTSVSPEIKTEHVKYLNSGDTPYGGKDRVVGYHSFLFYREGSTAVSNDFSLSEQDKIQLLSLARLTIKNQIRNNGFPTVDTSQFSNVIKTSCGAFVTLRKNNRLRGCIGQFKATGPLYKVVQQMAVAAAFHDYRFSPVTKQEMNQIEIEISVLTPLKKIDNIAEFELKKHGIYMVKGNRSGTFLPQVAKETGWNKTEFLGHCAQDKAGIGWNGWKDAELYTYEALIFSEKELNLITK
ncbi:MAG: AmmeMemoRadiSam system protein B [Prolixibacteraceae bacterium]|nr:AmmeMemoRadiSam system protein B [Prolixibacteraceae bacterium]